MKSTLILLIVLLFTACKQEQKKTKEEYQLSSSTVYRTVKTRTGRPDTTYAKRLIYEAGVLKDSAFAIDVYEYEGQRGYQKTAYVKSKNGDLEIQSQEQYVFDTSGRLLNSINNRSGVMFTSNTNKYSPNGSQSELKLIISRAKPEEISAARDKGSVIRAKGYDTLIYKMRYNAANLIEEQATYDLRGNKLQAEYFTYVGQDLSNAVVVNATGDTVQRTTYQKQGKTDRIIVASGNVETTTLRYGPILLGTIVDYKAQNRKVKTVYKYDKYGVLSEERIYDWKNAVK